MGHFFIGSKPFVSPGEDIFLPPVGDIRTPRKRHYYLAAFVGQEEARRLVGYQKQKVIADFPGLVSIPIAVICVLRTKIPPSLLRVFPKSVRPRYTPRTPHPHSHTTPTSACFQKVRAVPPPALPLPKKRVGLDRIEQKTF